MMRSLAAALLAAAVSAPAEPGEARPPAADDGDAPIAAGKRKLPGLALQLVPSRERYELGEAIDVTLRYTHAGERDVHVSYVAVSRSGRASDYRFTAVDEEGEPVRDPLAGLGVAGGGGVDDVLSADQPYEHKAVVNEWLRFDRPGRYSVTAHSRIVQIADGRWPESLVPLQSDAMEIEITPPVEANRLGRMEEARAALEGDDSAACVAAVRDLRFMLDPRAIPFLVMGLQHESSHVASEASFGLESFLDPAPVRAELVRVIEDESRFIMPRSMWYFVERLADIDTRAAREKNTPQWYEAHGEAQRRWGVRLNEKFKSQLPSLPAGRAAAATVEGLGWGPILSISEAAHWKRIAENARALSEEHQDRAGWSIKRHCRVKGVIPDLRRLAADEGLRPKLRSGAVVALHAMGDESLRDLVAEDMALPAPKLTGDAHATLGRYKAREIGQALLALAVPWVDRVSESAAKRLRDFDVEVTPEELCAALEETDIGLWYVPDALLHALARRSPEDALPFIREIVERPSIKDYDATLYHPTMILSRIDSYEAHRLILDLLHSDRAEHRRRMAIQLGASYGTAVAERKQPRSERRRYVTRLMPPSDSVAPRFVPELLALYKADPSESVRRSAFQALIVVAGTHPPIAWDATRDEMDARLPQIEEWWRKNGARYGRWGRVRRGLSIMCSADKGKYRVGETIRLTIRTRRVSPGGGSPSRVRLWGRVCSPDGSPEGRARVYENVLGGYEIQPQGGDPLRPGGEAVCHVEVPRTYRYLDRPCTLRFRVQYLFDFEGRKCVKDAVESNPVTIYIHGKPDDVGRGVPSA
ncbi:MAG: HEAT repeat domain-containing protein [Planctomycetota bacterium]|jgi:hypothetical protein